MEILIVIAVVVIVYVAAGLYWGFTTQAVIDSKNINEEWFWKGFFLWKLAYREATTMASHDPINYSDNKLLKLAEERENSEKIAQGTMWRCEKCGKANPDYTGTCICGNSKYNK